MKNKGLIAVMPLIFTFSCSTNNSKTNLEEETTITTSVSSESTSEEEKTTMEKYKTKRETSIIADSNFKNGFRLISPESTNQYFECNLDYNGEAESDTNGKGERPNYWDMCQWWTPFNFKDADYKKVGNSHQYENESRLLSVDPEKGEITMKLDAYEEYQELYNGPKPGDKSWSHFLIQQSFPDELKLSPSNIDSAEYGLHVRFDITVNEVTYKGEGTPVGTDCAQLLFYLQLCNYVPEGESEEESGKNGAKVWFGLPILDTRYTTVDKYVAGDTGFQGATGHLIYTIPSKTVLNTSEKIAIGKTYHVDIDVLEYIQEAFIYAATNGYLTNCKWNNIKVHYMNFGWEIPGQYCVSSTLKDLDVYVG